MKRILVSGFQAFGSEASNPSEKLVRLLKPYSSIGLNTPSQLEVRGIVLPVAFREAFEVLRDEIRKTNPDVVLAFGLALGRTRVEFERIAINCIDAEIPDNNGVAPRNQMIDSAGPAGLFSTLPYPKWIEVLKQNGIDVGVSNTAGTYVCNYLFYRLQEMSARTLMKTGFIHIPSESRLATPDLARVLELILKSVAESLVEPAAESVAESLARPDAASTFA